MMEAMPLRQWPMDAPMMEMMPPHAMGGAHSDMLEALPPEATAAMDIDTLMAIPADMVASVDWDSVPPEAMGAGIEAFQSAIDAGASPAEAFEAAGQAADPYMPDDIGEMNADRMEAMPPEAMAGMDASMMEDAA